jgi:hypothetical protein
MYGSHPYASGPQSYSEANHPGSFLGSFNEVDFAYALQRPGVVPMGESVSSSVDLNAGPNMHHHQQHTVGSYGTNHQQHAVGSYGTNRQQRGQRRGGSANNALTSRSYGEMPDANDSQRHSLATAPGLLGQHMAYGSQGSFAGQGEFVGNGVPQQNGMVQPPVSSMHQMGSAHLPQDSSMSADFQQQLAYGNAQAQSLAYIQQQHAALQQQQAILQQQQAALAFQQEQLRAYGGLNPAMNGNNGPNGANFGGMNQYGQAVGQAGNGYYYVPSADGTPMMSNQGVPQAGMTSSYGMLPQQQNLGYQPNYADGAGVDQGFHPPNPTNHYRGGMSM